MALKQRLHDDMVSAMKARDELRTATLRMVLSAVTTEEVAGRTPRELSDDDVLAVLARESKKRRESATAFDDAGRSELADRERAENGVLEGYLPAQVDDAEIAERVRAAIAETGAAGPQGMGAVMKVVKPQLAGLAEGGRIAAEVRRQLAG